MKDRIISDTHFLHAREVACGERKSWYEFKIENNWRRLVKDTDTIIHIWDVCCGQDNNVHEIFIKQLPGFKILVKGNHDNKSDSWYIDHGRDMVVQSMIIKRHGKEILFQHIPDDFSMDRAVAARNRVVMHWHYHAHWNDKILARHNHVLYSCERENMHPRTIQYMLNLLSSIKQK